MTQYPVVLIAGGTLVETVRRVTQGSYGGDLDAFLRSTVDEYAGAVTHRRPEEVINF